MLQQKNVFFQLSLYLKKIHSENKKICFCLKKKRMFFLIRKFFSHDFQTWFHDTNCLLYYPKMSVFSFQNFVVLLYLFLRNGTWKEYIPFSVHKNGKTFNKMSEKRSLGQSVLGRNKCMCGSPHVLCYGQSIICLPCMVRTSFKLVVLTKLNVSEL